MDCVKKGDPQPLTAKTASAAVRLITFQIGADFFLFKPPEHHIGGDAVDLAATVGTINQCQTGKETYLLSGLSPQLMLSSGEVSGLGQYAVINDGNLIGANNKAVWI